MKLRSASIALAGSIALTACADSSPLAPSADPAAAKVTSVAAARTYLVEFNGDAVPGGFAKQVAALGGAVVSSLDGAGVAVVNASRADFEKQAERIAGVAAVTPDIIVNWIDPSLPVVQMAINPTNDTFYPILWWLDAIDAPEAWAAGATGAGVRVAILDGGVYAAHEDLAANLDVAASRSFVPGTTFNQDIGTFWHGTHVAGIVAAADNAVGVVGVAPEATLISVKVLHGGSGSLAAVLDAIYYAATPLSEGGAGADVINMSLGAVIEGKPDDKGDRKDTKAFLKLLDRATTYAWKQGVTLVAATGNDTINFNTRESRTWISIPADAKHVIAVSATGPMGWALGSTDFSRQASYTNWGKSLVDLSAPGGDAALPGNQICQYTRANGTVSLQFCWVLDMVLSTARGTAATGGYSWASGTSMASPIVAGVAALIIGENGGDMHPAQVEAVLRQTAIDLGKPGFDDLYGHGWVNAARAVGAIPSTGPLAQK